MNESEMREGKEKERKGWKKRKQDQRGSAEARECPATRGLGILWQKSEDKKRKRRRKKRRRKHQRVYVLLIIIIRYYGGSFVL